MVVVARVYVSALVFSYVRVLLRRVLCYGVYCQILKLFSLPPKVNVISWSVLPKVCGNFLCDKCMIHKRRNC